MNGNVFVVWGRKTLRKRPNRTGLVVCLLAIFLSGTAYSDSDTDSLARRIHLLGVDTGAEAEFRDFLARNREAIPVVRNSYANTFVAIRREERAEGVIRFGDLAEVLDPRLPSELRDDVGRIDAARRRVLDWIGNPESYDGNAEQSKGKAEEARRETELYAPWIRMEAVFDSYVSRRLDTEPKSRYAVLVRTPRDLSRERRIFDSLGRILSAARDKGFNDFDKAVAGIKRSAFENCGQVCLGTERVYVQRPIFDRFVAVPEPHGTAVVCLSQSELLMSASAPRTAELLRGFGYSVTTVPISEFEKLEGCVTCLSVRMRNL